MLEYIEYIPYSTYEYSVQYMIQMILACTQHVTTQAHQAHHHGKMGDAEGAFLRFASHWPGRPNLSVIDLGVQRKIHLAGRGKALLLLRLACPPPVEQAQIGERILSWTSVRPMPAC